MHFAILAVALTDIVGEFHARSGRRAEAYVYFAVLAGLRSVRAFCQPSGH